MEQWLDIYSDPQVRHSYIKYMQRESVCVAKCQCEECEMTDPRFDDDWSICSLVAQAPREIKFANKALFIKWVRNPKTCVSVCSFCWVEMPSWGVREPQEPSPYPICLSLGLISLIALIAHSTQALLMKAFA